MGTASLSPDVIHHLSGGLRYIVHPDGRALLSPETILVENARIESEALNIAAIGHAVPCYGVQHRLPGFPPDDLAHAWLPGACGGVGGTNVVETFHCFRRAAAFAERSGDLDLWKMARQVAFRLKSAGIHLLQLSNLYHESLQGWGQPLRGNTGGQLTQTISRIPVAVHDILTDLVSLSEALKRMTCKYLLRGCDGELDWAQVYEFAVNRNLHGGMDWLSRARDVLPLVHAYRNTATHHMPLSTFGGYASLRVLEVERGVHIHRLLYALPERQSSLRRPTASSHGDEMMARATRSKEGTDALDICAGALLQVASFLLQPLAKVDSVRSQDSWSPFDPYDEHASSPYF